MAVIETRNLARRFGRNKVLTDVNLSVERGEIFGLIGPSGSGKSTLIRILTGHFEPSEGEVKVFGQPPGRFGASERRRLGFMPQGFILYPQLSVRRNLSFVAGLYGLGIFKRRRRIREVLRYVELWDARWRKAAKISGGMQKRLQLAAAMVHEPDILFIDEPTANLDPILRHKLWDRFEHLRDEGRTLFITTQYVDEAERCDRVGLLSGGTILASGTPDELRRKAFGGELIQLTLGGNMGTTGSFLEALERVGHVFEVRREAQDGKPLTRARMVVEDADTALPEIFEVLEGAEVLSADVHTPSFEEVFIRLEEPDQDSSERDASGS